MKQNKVLTYISISMFTLCAVVLAGVFCVKKENAFAAIPTMYNVSTICTNGISDPSEAIPTFSTDMAGFDLYPNTGYDYPEESDISTQGSFGSIDYDKDGDKVIGITILYPSTDVIVYVNFPTAAPIITTYAVTWNLTNGTGSPSTVTAGTSTALTLTPNTGYNVPNSGDVTISGSFDSAIYNQQSGTITITNPTSNITVTAIFPQIITSYSVTWNLTNGTGSPSTVTAGTSTALTLTPNSGYAFPYSGDITISGIYNSISYGINADNRVTTININRPTSNITITATFPAATYLVTWNLTNGMGSPSTVTGGNTETTLTLTPNDGYAFPASITLTGTASYDYNPATGIILVSSPRSDISIAANFQKTIASGTYFLPKIADLQGSPAFSIMTDNITLYYNNKTYATLDGVETADFVQLHIDKLGKDTLGLYFVDVETAPLGDNQYVIYLAANEYATSKYLYPLAYLYISNNITTGDAGVIAFFDNCYKVDNDLAYYTIYESAYPLVYEAALQYNLGYSAGYTDAANDNILADNTAGVITQIFSGIFGSVFSIELFPGFPIYLFILIPAVFAVFGLILWLIRGK